MINHRISQFRLDLRHETLPFLVQGRNLLSFGSDLGLNVSHPGKDLGNVVFNVWWVTMVLVWRDHDLVNRVNLLDHGYLLLLGRSFVGNLIRSVISISLV